MTAIRTTSLALLVALLAACGSNDATSHQFESGTYAISSATAAAAPDSNPDCSAFLANYQTAGKTIVVTVNGTAATIDTGASPADDTFATVTITGNTLEEGTTGSAARTDTSASGTCNVTLTRQFSGSITDDNALELTYTFKVAQQAASDPCDQTNSAVIPVPCSSAIHFVATKQ